jgi:hypothetical protein
MTENFKALAYLAPGTLIYPARPTLERLGDIHVPTLVMIGSLDSPSLHHIADTIASKVPGARKATIEGASHHPPVETPREFSRNNPVPSPARNRSGWWTGSRRAGFNLPALRILRGGFA